MELNWSLCSVELSECPSARIKVEELILEWLNINETGKLIDYLLDEASLRTSEGIVSPLLPDIPNINPPPRSPNSNRSPKKRLQSEISNLSQENKGDKNSLVRGLNESEEDTQTTRRRSNIDSIPVFFVRGRGHKSRKPIFEGFIFIFYFMIVFDFFLKFLFLNFLNFLFYFCYRSINFEIF